MTKVGLISDTHIPTRAKQLPAKIKEVFTNHEVKIILHAGDHVDETVVNKLNKVATVKAVKGNMDYNVDFPRYRSLEVDGVAIGLYHGGEIRPPGDIQQLQQFAKDREVKILVTGHTHTFFMEKKEGILVVNPGSPTNPQLRREGSFAILDPATKDIQKFTV